MHVTQLPEFGTMRGMSVSFEPFASRPHEKMKDVLMNPSASGPAVHYYMIRGGKNKRNITIVETGTVGGEYIKTYGHYHEGQLDETYWFVQGEGVVLKQKRAEEGGVPHADKIADFVAIRVKPGDSVYMPPGYAHMMANVGKEWLVMVDDSPVEGADDSASMPGHADYKPVQDMRGFAYYVIEREGKPALKRNANYSEIANTDFGGIPVTDG